MKRLISILLIALAASFMPATALAQGPVPNESTTPNTGAFKTEPVKQLRQGVDAWPSIVNPATPAELRVNAALTRLNQRLAQALRECDANANEQMKPIAAAAKGPDPASGDWSRTVKVTMQGPRFLSLVAIDSYVNCGGAHPDSDTMAMVFDMTAGTPVNWPAMVAKSAGASSFVDSVADGSKVGALVLPALAKIYATQAGADCKEAFQDPQSFLIWPDAKQGTLVVEAFDLPHVVQACATNLNLTIAQARELRFDESLLSAIEQAHRQPGN